MRPVISKHWQPYPITPECKLYLPLYKYGSNTQKMWDISGNHNDGVVSGCVPYPGNPSLTQLGATYNYGDFTATNAFFWSSIDLSSLAGTDLGYTPNRVVVVDGAGKIATGYLAGVGAGETLGDELVTNGNFASAEPPGTAWIKEAVWTVSGGVGVCAGSGSIFQVISWSVGGLYKVTLDLISRAAGSEALTLNGVIVIDYQSIPANYTGYQTAFAGSDNYILVYGNVFTGTIDNAILKRVTDPPAIGLHVVSSLNGTTRAWESVESGFNPNTITSWSIHSIIPSECIGWYFNGVDDRIVHPSITLTKTHTLHYWLKRTSTDDTPVIHGGTADYHGLKITDTTVSYSAAAGSVVAVSHNGVDTTTRNTLFSVTRLLDQVTFYQDGLQICATQTLPVNDNQTLTDLGRYSDGTYYFNGILYDVLVYSDCHSAQDVRNFYELTRHIYGNQGT